MDITFGALAFLGLDLLMITFPRHRSRTVAGMVDLQLAPSDGIAVIAALLAVVLSINLAIAVQPLPPDRSDRVLAIEWQKYVASTAQLIGMAAVLMCLAEWTSSRRSHSWGATLGATLLTLATIALAGAVKLRSSDQIAEELDAYHRVQERLRLNEAMARFNRTHPSRPASPASSMAGVVLLAVILALACTSVFTLTATVVHQSPATRSCARLFVLGCWTEAALLAAGSRLWHMPIAKNKRSSVGEAFPVIWLTTLWLLIGIAAVLAPESAIRIPLISYFGASVLLPAAVLAFDRQTDLGGLTLPLRQASRRRLDRQLKLYHEEPKKPAKADHSISRPKSRMR